MAGKFEVEYRFAIKHPELPACKTLLDLADLYIKHQDKPTLGLILGAVEEVRKVMK